MKIIKKRQLEEWRAGEVSGELESWRGQGELERSGRAGEVSGAAGSVAGAKRP